MTKEVCEQIIKENSCRLKRGQKSYDPYSGVGSPVERSRLRINSDDYMLIPMRMCCNEEIEKIIACGSIHAYCLKWGLGEEE
ncbi:MAG: hypothetical protein RR550_03580, partial [Rikenellaceae bacterium]